MREIAKRFLEDQNFTKEEFEELLKGFENKEERAAFREKAAFLRGKYYGDKVFTRGLIEFTNYCKNNCYYCGIRGGNKHVVRYRLTKEEILECCKEGYALGFRTFVLQGGEDPWFTDERMVEIIREIKGNYSDCALTLSIGEKSYESYKRFREAGADRYLLRHEKPGVETQVLREIDWFLKYYRDIRPAMYIAYDRIAAYDTQKPELRVTFDWNIRFRNQELDLKKGTWGQQILEEGQQLMEIKIPGAMPVWLCELLDQLCIYPVSFSKYGKAYRMQQAEERKDEGGKYCA